MARGVWCTGTSTRLPLLLLLPALGEGALRVAGRSAAYYRTTSGSFGFQLGAQAKSIVMYPAFVGFVVISVLFFMMIYVVPQMVDFIREMGQELPIHTRALIAFSNFIVGNWWWVIPLPPVVFFLISYSAKRDERMRYRVDSWKLNFWYTGSIVSKIILSRFASYFALLYSAGLDVLAALKRVRPGPWLLAALFFVSLHVVSALKWRLYLLLAWGHVTQSRD